MKIIEANPLPQRCIDCPDAKEGEALGLGSDAYCYNCDYALDRFIIVDSKLPQVDERKNFC